MAHVAMPMVGASAMSAVMPMAAMRLHGSDMLLAADGTCGLAAWVEAVGRGGSASVCPSLTTSTPPPPCMEVVEVVEVVVFDRLHGGGVEVVWRWWRWSLELTVFASVIGGC